MSEPRTPRRFLGKARTVSDRVRTYWTDEALEVDQADHFEIRRRRVFFDEILLVTLHSTRGLLISLLPFSFALLFTIAAMAAADEPSASKFFWLLTAFFVAAAVALAFIPIWVVTVYGRRTRARMHFRLRQGKARRIYAEICRAAADAQRALSQRLAAQAPEPLPQPLPLPDEDLPPAPPQEPLPSP